MQATFAKQLRERQADLKPPRRLNVPDSPDPGGPGNVVLGRRSRATGGSTNGRGLIEALMASKVFQEYERAFTEATGLPVALRPVETWQLPHHGKRNEGRWCALMSEKSRACASCLQMQ